MIWVMLWENPRGVVSCVHLTPAALVNVEKKLSFNPFYARNLYTYIKSRKNNIA